MRTDQEIFETIANVVTAAAPEGWTTLVVRANLEDDTGETLYDAIDAAGNQNWFCPETLDQYEVYEAFDELRSRMKHLGQGWMTARLTLSNAGNFKIEFDYDGNPIP